jgi:hypothetical protein
LLYEEFWQYVHSQKVVIALILLAVTAISENAHAQQIAINLTTPPARVGSQDSGGVSLGKDFTVFNAVSVIELGVFDSGQDGFVGNHTAAVYSRTGNTGVLLTSALFTPGSPGTLTSPSADTNSAYRFKTIATFLLNPGTYTIVADGFTGGDPNGNNFSGDPIPLFNTGGGAIGFGSSRFGSGPGVFPATPDTATYLAGTFTYQPFFTPTPEPDSLALLAGLVLSGSVLAIKRRRK